MVGDRAGGQAGPKQLRRLLDSVLVIGSELDLETVLLRIAEAAVDLVDARYGALGVLDERQIRLVQFITVGIDDEGRAAIGELPQGHGILGLLIVDPRPLRLPDLNEHPDAHGFPPNHPPMATFLGVPIRVRGRVFGNLYLCEKAGGEVFTDVDEEMVVALATAAGVAIDNARLHARTAEIALLEDRERIARELHDTVIQRLFATGLSLQGAIRMTETADIRERVEQAVDDLDATIKQVRSAIFELHTARAPGRSLRQEMLALAAESARSLEFEPRLQFEGPIDTLVDDELGDDVLAVLREALANVARHADAGRVDVSVSVDPTGALLVVVRDDGRGVKDGASGGRGLANLIARAEQRGGTCRLERLPAGGSVLAWRVLLGAG